jgi:Fusaric acid resistance protein-like
VISKAKLLEIPARARSPNRPCGMLDSMPTPDQKPSAAQQLLADSTVFRWQNQTLGADLIFTLPVAVCLSVGLASGHPGVGLLIAGGAANTGFGQKHRIDNSRWVPMIFVTLGMAFSGFAGVLVGHENLLLVALAALWAFGYGLLTARPEGYAWVGQQCVITFLVASAYPASLGMAAIRGLLLFAGGAMQLILSSLLLRRFHRLRDHLFELAGYARDERAALLAALTETAQSVRQRRYLSSAMPYALRLAAAVGLATEIYRRLHYPSGYWIPMTALLVLKPGLTDTVSRVFARVLGTMCGAVAISFLLAHVNPKPIALAVFTVFFAWLAYGLTNVNYALFSMAVTGYIVFLLALNQVPGPTIALHRTIATALGSAIALCLRLAVIFVRRRHWLRAAALVRRGALPRRLSAE